MSPSPPPLASAGALFCVGFVVFGIACAKPVATTPDTRVSADAGLDDAGIDADADAGMAELDEGEDEPDGESDGAEDGEEAMDDAPCPEDMVLVDDGQLRFCIDKYEDSLVEVQADGTEQPYPHYLPVDGHTVRAVSRPGVFPQGFVSELQAADACEASGKRLCAYDEWKTACMGPSRTTFPYGDARQTGTCHDNGKSAVGAVFGMKALASSTPVTSTPANRASPSSRGASAPSTRSGAKGSRTTNGTSTKGRALATNASNAALPRGRNGARASSSPSGKSGKNGASRSASGPTNKGARSVVKNQTPAKKGGRKPARSSQRPASVDPSVWTRLNDPALGQVEGALAKTGDHGQCVNGYGAYDLVGNLHEWVATDPKLPHGTFAGGYYLDTTLNGDGCRYKTQAHAHDYHDYSTGFRCCAGARTTGDSRDSSGTAER